MPRNNLHSFTLSYDASKVVRREPRGRKSKFVSKAIHWYDRVAIRKPETGKQRMRDFVDDHEKLMENFRLVCLERDELKKSQSFISKIRNKWSK